MGVTTQSARPGSGSPSPGFEDEALLRGEGRYMDDIDPVPHAGHAAILRSPFAHARVNALDPARALELPGVIGVLTGADVARLSRPFPVGVPDAPPYYAAAHEVARYAGEPLAVVVARDRYVAEDALELIELDLEPLDAVADPDAGEVVSDRSFTLRGRRERLRPRGPRRLRAVPDAALVVQPGRDLRRRRRLEPSRRARSRPGRTSRGRSRCTRWRPAPSA